MRWINSRIFWYLVMQAQAQFFPVLSLRKIITFNSHSKKTCFFCQEVHGRRSLKIRIPFSMQKSLMSLFDRQILTRIVTVKIHNAKDLRRRYPLFQVSSSVKKFKLFLRNLLLQKLFYQRCFETNTG